MSKVATAQAVVDFQNFEQAADDLRSACLGALQGIWTKLPDYAASAAKLTDPEDVTHKGARIVELVSQLNAYVQSKSVEERALAKGVLDQIDWQLG